MTLLTGVLLALAILVGLGLLLGRAGRSAGWKRSWTDPWAIKSLADRANEATARIPSGIRLAGLPEDLELLQRSIDELAALAAEVEREQRQPMPKAAAAALAGIHGVIARNLELLRGAERVNRLAQQTRRLADQPPDLAGRRDGLLALERDLEGARASIGAPQAQVAIAGMLDWVRSARLVPGSVSGLAERGALPPDEWITREGGVEPGMSAWSLNAAASPAEAPSEAELEAALGIASVIVRDYAWALESPQESDLTAALGLAHQQPGSAAAHAALTRAIEAAPVPVTALIVLRRMVFLKAEAVGPAAWALRDEIESIEAAYRAGSPPVPAALAALAVRIQSLGANEVAKVLSARPGSSALPSALSRAEFPPPRRTEMPATLTDRVHFSVSAPPTVLPGAAFVVEVWAHLERQRAEVVRRIQEAVSGAALLAAKGPVPLARGTVVTLRLTIDDLLVDDPEDTILWDAEIGTASFPVKVPDGAAPGARAARVTIHVGGVQVAKLHFSVAVGAVQAPAGALPIREDRHRRAFASYASPDREEVLTVLQGIQKGVPGLDVFLDVAALRSGERWQDRLRVEIDSRDVLYLFWSEAARQSTWVEREWRYAYESRGLDFIDPVPLVSPELVPPPAELADLHFNDWVHAYKRRR